MKNPTLALTALLLTACAAGGVQAAPRYTLSALPPAPGIFDSVADINDLGQVVGIWKRPPDDDYDDARGFIYTPGSGFHPIHPPGWNPFVASPLDLNNRGEAVGAYLNQPYVYRPDGSGGFIPSLPRPIPRLDYPLARAINEQGQIVGRTRASAAFYYDIAQGPRLIRPAVSGREVAAHDINNAGVVLLAETDWFASDRSTSTQLYLFDTATWSRQVITGPAGPAVNAALNDRGDVAFTRERASQQHEAVLLSGGREVILGPLPGDSFNTVVQMDNRGRVLGWSSDGYYEPERRSWLYTPDDGVLDLLSLVDATSLGGWSDLRVSAMNEIGQLAGVGVFGGVNRGFVLNLAAPVPEPATALLLLVGAAVVGRRVSRSR
jgi:hypothetical protein